MALKTDLRMTRPTVAAIFLFIIKIISREKNRKKKRGYFISKRAETT